MNPGKSTLSPAAPVTVALCVALLGCLLAAFCLAAPVDAKVKVSFRKVGRAYQPTSATSPPGRPGMLYVTERTGKIRILKARKWIQGGPFLDLSDRVRTRWVEQGLLGLAFPPDFKKSRRFYVDYIARNGDVVIEEYKASREDPNHALPESRRLILRIPKVNGRGNHNGGTIRFLGDHLYIAIGDGNDPGDAKNNSQNLESLRGKILRIDPRGSSTTGRTYLIPSTNPFVGQPGRDEIFAYGFRNPHSFSFHQIPGGEGMMVISDVGQERYEELNYLPFRQAWGGNFGWKLYEGLTPYDCGKLCPSGITPAPTGPVLWPQLVYSHKRGCAIIGGPVVRDPAMTKIRGKIIYGDFCTNRIRVATPRTGWINRDRRAGIYLPPGRGKYSALNGFGEDGWGRVYALSGFGGIYLLIQKNVPVRKKGKKKPGKKKPGKKSQTGKQKQGTKALRK